MPVSIGVQLPEVERVVRWPELAEIATTAEAAGLDSIWVGDHLLYRDPDRGPWEAWTQLAALAAITERVTLGPLVACLGFHPPAVLAKMAATIDEISGGRFVLGVGSGWNQAEFDAFGLPFDHKVSRFEEAFAIVRGLLARERVTFEGTYWSADGAVLLPTPSRTVPLMSGVAGPRALAITLPHVESWNTWWADYGNTADGFAVRNAEITAACEAAGRDPADVRRSACVLVTIDGSASERPADVPPVPHTELSDHLAALEQAGAHEAILILDPITDASVATVGDVLAH
jgi:alkanesulfonate monooxygenase SsuD/methylene tetrahydromethanopterin reductase-like flavin-dependent oxidoreductase (luciferase family)